MIGENSTHLYHIVQSHESELLADWISLLSEAGIIASGRIKESELRTQCRQFLDALRQAIESGNFTDAESEEYGRMRDLLGDLSRSRAARGVSPSETATFVFSLKQPLFKLLRREYGNDAEAVANESWLITRLVDKLGLYTIELHQQGREEVVDRQSREIAELSTPVVKLWDGIVALPLIGTLDSARTQVVMENLLQSIVEQDAEIAIIDITGVPTVDTLVAQHLLKTVAAARLMGADCLVSGIRPQIAQTMVHLGVELNVISKASLADAFALALQRTGKTVIRSKAAEMRS